MYQSEQDARVAIPTQRRRRRKRRLPYIPLVAAGVIMAFCMILNFGRGAGNPVTQVAALGTPVSSTNQTPHSKVKPEEASAWYLTLVNPWNSLPEGREITLAQLEDGHSVDERCYSSLKKMMEDCQSAGQSPVICSSYRSQEKQKRLYQNQVDKYISRGYTAETAKVEAAKAVAIPGTSEHQLGLAVDIVDFNNQNLDKSQESTPVQKWLMANCWQYGFILRYPNNKSETTGIIYEPWHYRYVGKEAAEEIHEQGICLEEYLAQLQAQA